MLNMDHAFFAPAWRRYLTVAICALWGLFELATGAVIWGAIFIGIGALAQWQFTKVDWSKYESGA